MVLLKSSALAKTKPRAAVWVASTSAVVHAMVVVGCFGDQGCLWVAVSYLGVAAEYDYGWAAAYDLAICSKAEQDPSLKAADALPYYREQNIHTMLDLKMRLAPPSRRSDSSRSTSTAYAEQEPADQSGHN